MSGRPLIIGFIIMGVLGLAILLVKPYRPDEVDPCGPGCATEPAEVPAELDGGEPDPVEPPPPAPRPRPKPAPKLKPTPKVKCAVKSFTVRKLNRTIQVAEEELRDIKKSIAVLTSPPHDDGALTLFSLWKKCRKKADANCDDMTYLYTSWLVLDYAGNIVIAKEPPYPPTTKKYNPVTRRGKGLKFLNATHVIGLLGSAWEPPYEPYRTFIWNIDTHEVSLYPVHSHHDIDFNPNTNTFMTLTNTNGLRTGKPWTFEWMDEVTLQGNSTWHWDGSALFKYIDRHDALLRKDWQFCMHAGRRECGDKVHANTVIWVYEEDVVYFNSRHLDTFYKVNKTTGEVIWGVGRVGHFKIYDEKGEPIKKLVHHAHQLSMLSNNRFLLFDNGLDMTSYTAVEVDEANETARVIFKWTAPKELFQPAMGGVMITPAGRYLGSLGYGAFLSEFADVKPANASIVEVTPDKKEWWKLQLREADNFQWLFYRVERFYENPVILASVVEESSSGAQATINITTWNSYNIPHTTEGRVYILRHHTNEILACSKITYQPYWLPTEQLVELPCLLPGENHLVAISENAEGFSGVSETFTVTVPKSAAGCSNLCLTKDECVE